MGRVKINRMKGNRPFEEVESLTKTIGDYYVYFLNLSKYYEEHFNKQMLKKNKDFKLGKQSTTMVNDYYVSIEHFIKSTME